MMGDLQYLSYIKGCSIHNTFQRAIALHGIQNAIVQVSKGCQQKRMCLV